MELQGGADAGAKSDLSLERVDGADGSWVIEIESGVGRGPRIEERIRRVVLALLDGCET